LTDSLALSQIAAGTVWDAWKRRDSGRGTYDLDVLSAWASGEAGTPIVDPDASEELQDLAKISKLKMCRTVVRTFLRGLSVIGFRSPTSQDNHSSWSWWQRHGLDAKQSEVHKLALELGSAYVAVLPDHLGWDQESAKPQIYSPKNVIAEYDERDSRFPAQAVLFRETVDGYGALLVDRYNVYPVKLRYVAKEAAGAVGRIRHDSIEVTGEPWTHGATYNGHPVCPVVAFVDVKVGEDSTVVRGEGVVGPIIDLNKAINQVNFDRLIVSRYGAFDQKMIIGWTDTKARLEKLNAAHIGAIDAHPADVRIDRWQASPLEPYNELIRELREQIAIEAAVPLFATGSISNVSSDTVAMLQNAHAQELDLKQESFGESWEMVIRIAVAMRGEDQPDDGAEVMWKDKSAKSLAGVVDGITKLSAEGVPIEELLDMVPGLGHQKIEAIKIALAKQRGRELVHTLLAPTQVPPLPETPADD